MKALATAEEYNLEALAYGLLNQQLYVPNKISTSTNCKYIFRRKFTTFLRINIGDASDCAIEFTFSEGANVLREFHIGCILS